MVEWTYPMSLIVLSDTQKRRSILARDISSSLDSTGYEITFVSQGGRRCVRDGNLPADFQVHEMIGSNTAPYCKVPTKPCPLEHCTLIERPSAREDYSIIQRAP